MRVLVACEYSGIVRDAFCDAGHDAWSCDLLPTEGRPEHNYKHCVGDIFEFVANTRPWDMLIAHPPCTYLTNAGVRWLHERPERWDQMREGAQFFKDLLALPITKKCLENPVMHGHAQGLIGRKWSQTFQPWQHGDPEFKRVCLWLEELPPLVDSNRLMPPKPGTPEYKAWSKVFNTAPGPERAKLRSRFFPGVAKAMAEQWG